MSSQSLLSTANLDLICSFQTTLTSVQRHICPSSEVTAVSASLKQGCEVGSAHVMSGGGQCCARENTLHSPPIFAHVCKDGWIFSRL